MGKKIFTCGERLLLIRCSMTGRFHECIKTITISDEKYEEIMKLPVSERNFTATCKKHKCKCGKEFK